MKTWKKRANSGLWWELIINQTVRFYHAQKIALIHKLPLETKIFQTDRAGVNKRVTDAVISAKSRADYYGLWRGKFIAFEAKSTVLNTWHSRQLKAHQLNYLLEVKKLGGISFCLVAFLTENRFFMLPSVCLSTNQTSHWDLTQMEKTAYEIRLRYPGYIDLIDGLKSLVLAG